jgi:hypothetical protein
MSLDLWQDGMGSERSACEGVMMVRALMMGGSSCYHEKRGRWLFSCVGEVMMCLICHRWNESGEPVMR